MHGLKLEICEEGEGGGGGNLKCMSQVIIVRECLMLQRKKQSGCSGVETFKIWTP